MMFRYFKEADGTGAPHRVNTEDAGAYETDKADNGEAKYIEVPFKEWWETGIAEDTKKLRLEGAEEGTFLDDTIADKGALVLSLEDGEPVEYEEAEEAEGAEETQAEATEGEAVAVAEEAVAATEEGVAEEAAKEESAEAEA